MPTGWPHVPAVLVRQAVGLGGGHSAVVVDGAGGARRDAVVAPVALAHVHHVVARVVRDRAQRADRLAGVAADADLGVNQVLFDDGFGHGVVSLTLFGSDCVLCAVPDRSPASGSCGRGALLRSCPPACGLLLDLTAQCTPTTRSGATVGAPGEPTAAQLVGVGVYQSEVKEETEGQGLQLGDMSGGTCPRAPADSAPTLIGVRLS